MSAVNIRSNLGVKNYQGGPAKMGSVERTLIRLTLASMLWEDQFYIDGTSNADIVKKYVAMADPAFVAELAIQARTVYNLRHVPLLLVRELARSGKLQADTLEAVIQRPDEMGEFLSIYWKEGKTPISNQVKKGLAKAFVKFNEYSLAKFDKNSANVSVRDVMFLTHAKPKDAAQAELFKRIASNSMNIPDTWETELSRGADKRETFTRLMAERKLGALAFIRNLRNMVESGVSKEAMINYGLAVDTSKVLPFRYIAAARQVSAMTPLLETMMLAGLAKETKLPGKTVLLVDVSGSMFGVKVSEKSDLARFDAAAALAILLREICEEVEIYTFSNFVKKIDSSVKGLALPDALFKSQYHSGTELGEAMSSINANTRYDRIMVFTDEQASGHVPAPKGKGYMINVASYKHGVSSSGNWESITGFSEAIVKYIQALEA